MEQPHELTREEVRDIFLDHIRDIARYWASPDRRVTSELERCNGVAFSILSAIDGCSGFLPGFVLAPAPHPLDKAYHQANDESWYPAAPDVSTDIGGGLHERFYK